MKRNLATLSILCFPMVTSSLGCGGMSVQAYIDQAKTTAHLQKELEPPPCAQGEEGKTAIIKAFRDNKANPPGSLPLATFLSLSCLRVKQVKQVSGAVRADQIFVANVPVDKDTLETMVDAWKATKDEEVRKEMNGELLFLDHLMAFQLYAAFQAGDKPLAPDDIHPKGAYFPIDGASKEETETVRKAWCQYVAPGAYERFFSDRVPLDSNGALIRDTEMAGLIGNQCPETDRLLVELIKRIDKNAKTQEDQWYEKEKLSRGAFVSTSELTLHKDAAGYPLISHLGKDIAGQGRADPNRTKHYLELLSQTGHSCAFGANIKGGLEGALSVTPELDGAIKGPVTTYKEFLRNQCGELP